MGRSLVRFLVPAFRCKQIFIKRETSGYEAAARARFYSNLYPHCVTMKPQINLHNIGQGINQQMLKGRVSELKVFLKQIGENLGSKKGIRNQPPTYFPQNVRVYFVVGFVVVVVYAKRQKKVLSLIPYVPNSPPLLSCNLIDWKQLRADRVNINSL